jgi:hypothetical protein
MTEASALAEKLRTEGEKFNLYFAALPEQQWEAAVYTEGETWTTRSILAHLMTAERAFLKLFEDIRQGGPGVSEDFVIDRYNARQQEKMKDLGPAELLEQYRSVRAQMIAWVANLDDPELDRTGRHPFLGIATLREMIKMVYIHNQTHYRDIRKSLKA